MIKTIFESWMWENVSQEFDIVAVVDVYAATTNIAYIASQKPNQFLIVNEQNFDLAKEMHPESILIGESHKDLPFDIGNEPADIQKYEFEGKTVLYMSTNGTKALEKYKNVQTLLTCSFTNLDTLANFLQNNYQSSSLHIVKAGSTGHKVEEDEQCASCIKSLLLGENIQWDQVVGYVSKFTSHFFDYTDFRSQKHILQRDIHQIVPILNQTNEGWLSVVARSI